METTPDRLRAVALSLGLHSLVAFVLYIGLLRQPELQGGDAEGPTIEATLVGAPAHSTAASVPRVSHPQPTPPAPTPPPRPAPVPQEQPRQLQSQTQVPKPDTVDQDEVRRQGLQAAAQQQREQDERRRQEQIDLDRKQEQLQAEARQRQADAALAKQLADIRAKRAEADRQVKLAQEKMKQDEDMRKSLAQNSAPARSPTAAAHPAAAAGDGGLLGKYMQAIHDVVNQNWRREGTPERTHCVVHFKQLPGGEVFDVSFGNCPFDASARASVEDALKKTPLPYAGYESVFSREGTIDMCYPEEACK